MTRDEAIELRIKHLGAFTKAAMPADVLQEITAAEVDFYIAIGMLKLDEMLISRSSPMYQLYEALFEHIPTLDFMSFRELIDKSGLKITEK